MASLPKATGDTGARKGPPRCKDTSSAMLLDRRGDDGFEILEETGTADTNNITILNRRKWECCFRGRQRSDGNRLSTKMMKIDDSYDSKGELLYITEELCDDDDNEAQNSKANVVSIP